MTLIDSSGHGTNAFLNKNMTKQCGYSVNLFSNNVLDDPGKNMPRP